MATPEDNVEIVRQYFGWTGKEGLEKWAARAGDFWEKNGDYYPVAAFPEARPCHGPDQVVAFLTDFLSAWDSYDYEVLDARAVSDDRVFMRGRIKAEGRASGASLEGDIYHCCWMRHGRFIRIEDHLTEKGALEALG
ncbi:MAG: nuclear transport factor 2 family protein [Solirubrobacterales bacterium]